MDVETHNPTSSTITLTWKPPMYDGGAKIMGYVLEKQLKGEEAWGRCNDFLVPVLSYTVRGLTEGKSYAFRVRAENPAGVSEPSRASLHVKISDAVGKNHVSLEMQFPDISTLHFDSAFAQTVHMLTLAFTHEDRCFADSLKSQAPQARTIVSQNTFFLIE